MIEEEVDYMVPNEHHVVQDFQKIIEKFYFMQTRRNTWVCMTCFSNVDEHYRKQHAFWHSLHRQLPTQRMKPQPEDALNKKRILFRVDVAYSNGEYWINSVEFL